MKPTDLSVLKANAVIMAGRLKLMSHPERLAMLCRMDEGEVSVRELVELSGLSQSSVSQHLAMLREEDVVSIRSEAQTRFYSLKDPIVRGVIHTLANCAKRPSGDTGPLSHRRISDSPDTPACVNCPKPDRMRSHGSFQRISVDCSDRNGERQRVRAVTGAARIRLCFMGKPSPAREGTGWDAHG